MNKDELSVITKLVQTIGKMSFKDVSVKEVVEFTKILNDVVNILNGYNSPKPAQIKNEPKRSFKNALK